MTHRTDQAGRNRTQALVLALIPMVALGFARFAYGAILPSMRSELGWSYRMASLPAISNGIGYLIGALTGARVTGRFGAIPAAVASLVITALATGSVALSGDVWWISSVRLLAGCSGAWAYVAGAVASTALRASGVRMAMVWYPAGTGVGIVVSACVGLWVRDRSELWNETWLVLGIVGLATAPVVLHCVRGIDEIVPPRPAAPFGGFSLVGWTIPVAYGLFGAGYICVATFGVSYLSDQGLSVVVGQLFWIVVGVAIAVSGPLWASFFETASGGLPLALPIAGCAAAAALFVVPVSTPAALLAAVLLGSCLLNTTVGISTMIHRQLEPALWGRAFAAITAAFAVGQMLGPLAAVVAGEQADSAYGILLVSAALLAVGAAVAALPTAPTE